MLVNLGQNSQGSGVWSVDALVELFSNRRVVLIAWIHFLVFDLFVGSWVAHDAAREGISRWLVAPCLFLVLVMGPIGLLMYFALRGALRRSWAVLPAEPASKAS